MGWLHILRIELLDSCWDVFTRKTLCLFGQIWGSVPARMLTQKWILVGICPLTNWSRWFPPMPHEEFCATSYPVLRPPSSTMAWIESRLSTMLHTSRWQVCLSKENFLPHEECAHTQSKTWGVFHISQESTNHFPTLWSFCRAPMVLIDLSPLWLVRMNPTPYH